MSGYSTHRHAADEVQKFIVHLDGGGLRQSKRHGDLPATWAALISTEAADGARAFFCYSCGVVVVDPSACGYIGATGMTSTSGGISAQAMGALLVRAWAKLDKNLIRT